MSDYKNLRMKDSFDGTASAFVKDLILRSDAGFQEGMYDAFGTDIEFGS